MIYIKKKLHCLYLLIPKLRMSHGITHSSGILAVFMVME